MNNPVKQAKDAIKVGEKNNIRISTGSLEAFIKHLPKKAKKLAPEVKEYYLKVLEDEPDMVDDLISYTKVLEGGKFSVDQYINAVRFVSYQMMGYNNTESYLKVFPEKLGTLHTDKYAAKYNKSKLVTELHKLVVVPEYLTHMHLRNQALKVQTDLMLSAKSEMVKHLASKTILEMTKPPEENYMQVDVNVKKDDSIEAIEQALYQTATKLVKGIQDKQVTAKEVLETDIMDVDYEESN